MSAQAPAGSASTTIGRLEAACTNDTSNGEVSINSHCAPTVCIQVPTFDANCATHSARNTRLANGAHAESVAPRGGSGLVDFLTLPLSEGISLLQFRAVGRHELLSAEEHDVLTAHEDAYNTLSGPARRPPLSGHVTRNLHSGHTARP